MTHDNDTHGGELGGGSGTHLRDPVQWSGCLGQEARCKGQPPRWGRDPARSVTMPELKRIAYSFGLSIADLQSKKRSQSLVRARAHVALVLRNRGLSLTEIGDVMKRDHSTIIPMLRKVQGDAAKTSKGEQADEARENLLALIGNCPEYGPAENEADDSSGADDEAGALVSA